MKARIPPLPSLPRLLCLALSALLVPVPPSRAEAAPDRPGTASFQAAVRAASEISAPTAAAAQLAEIAAAQAAGDREEARRTLQGAAGVLSRIPEGEGRDYPLSRIAIAQARFGAFDEALKRAAEIRASDFSKDQALAAIAEGQWSAGQKSAAFSTAQLRLANARATGDVAGQVSSLAQAGEMLARFGQREGSAAAFREAVAAARGALDAEHGYAGVVRLLEIARAQLRAGQKDAAAATLAEGERAAEKTGEVFWFSDIALLQREAGAAEAVTATLNAAQQIARAKENPDQRRLALYLVAKGWADAGRFAEALHVARSFGELEWRAAALQQVAAAQVKAGRKEEGLAALAEALRLARGIPNTPKADTSLTSRYVALRSLGETQLRAGQKKAALLTLADALRSARTIERPLWRAVEIIKIAEVQARAGEREAANASLAEALPLARSLTEKDLAAYRDAHPLWNGMKVQLVMRDFDGALKTADALKEDAVKARTYCLTEMVRLMVREGQFSHALQTAGMIPDARQKAAAFLSIAVAQSGG